MITISQRLKQASSELAQASGEEARLEAELLLADVLTCTYSQLHTWPHQALLADQLVHFEQHLSRRKQGEPIAYILGYQAFWKQKLSVNRHCLIPRSDTELLVETSLELDLPQYTQALDLGTGAGAIALALASERLSWTLEGTDIDEQALKVAASNAISHGLQVIFYRSHWFQNLAQDNYQLIVSNPPYIDPSDPHLQQLLYEPQSALIAAEQGLSNLRHIIANAPRFLSAGGYLLVEHGYNQGPAVIDLLQQHGFSQLITRKDIQRHPRVAGGQWLQ